MLKDMALYALLAAVITASELPSWLLSIPALAAISAATRHIVRGS